MQKKLLHLSFRLSEETQQFLLFKGMLTQSPFHASHMSSVVASLGPVHTNSGPSSSRQCSKWRVSLRVPQATIHHGFLHVRVAPQLLLSVREPTVTQNANYAWKEEGFVLAEAPAKFLSPLAVTCVALPSALVCSCLELFCRDLLAVSDTLSDEVLVTLFGTSLQACQAHPRVRHAKRI